LTDRVTWYKRPAMLVSTAISLCSLRVLSDVAVSIVVIPVLVVIDDEVLTPL